MRVAEQSGIRLEGRGRASGHMTFHVGGADEFAYEHKEIDGKPVIVLTLVEPTNA